MAGSMLFGTVPTSIPEIILFSNWVFEGNYKEKWNTLKQHKLFWILSSVFLFSCREMKEIKVTSVEGFYVNKLTTENIDAEIKLKIDNPNGMGFSIYPSEFDVVFSGIRLGKAKLNKRVHLNSGAEKVYTFKLNSKLYICSYIL